MFGYNNLRKKVKELEQKVWCLQNPPLFKKGDSVIFLDANMTVIETEVRHYSVTGFENTYHLIDSNFDIYIALAESDIKPSKATETYRECGTN